MNLLDGIDKSSYSLIFSEEGDTSPRANARAAESHCQSLKPKATKPHTVLSMKTTLVNGSYSKCDSSSDIDSEEQRPLVQSEFKLGVSPIKSNALTVTSPTLTTLPSYNLMSNDNVSITQNPYSANPNSCYNIEYVSSTLSQQPPKGSPESNDLQKTGSTSAAAAGMYSNDVTTVPAKPLPKHNWGPDPYSSNLSTGATVNSYSEGQKILPPNYFIKDYSDIFGNIANYETDDVAKLPIISEESKMFLIGLSSNNENEDEDTMENEDQGSSNSPFQSATEEMGGDGDHDHDQDPLLIRPPPKQNVFHQFIRSAKSSKNRMKQSRKHSLKDMAQRDPGSSTALIKEVEIGNEEPGNGGPHSPVHGRKKCSIGILLAAISCVFFATSALIVKISSLHPMELLAVRGLIQGILVSPIVISSGNSFLGPAGSRSLLLARAVLGAVALVMGFASIHLIPLADAATVIFTSPVFVSIFACLCLGEVCSWFDISIIALTLIGVLLVSKPSFNFINTGTWTGIGGTFCALAAAMLTALAFIVLRQLKQVHYSVTVFWFSTVLAIFGSVLTVALDGFTLPRTWASIMECLGIGFCGFMGQVLLTKALKTENALSCSVVRTLDIVLAFFYQITLLHDTPDWYSYLGSVVVISSVVVTAFRRWYKESGKQYTRVHKIADDDPMDDSQPESSTSRQGNFS